MKQFKINLDNYIEQDAPYSCPECYGFDKYRNYGRTTLTWNNISGWGNYPIGGYRNKLRPNKFFGIGFICPKCFTKSVAHFTEKQIEDVFESILTDIEIMKSSKGYPNLFGEEK